MPGFLSLFIDALFPPPEDVQAARDVAPERIRELVSPHAAGETWISALLPYRDPSVRAVIRALKYGGDTQKLAVIGEILGEYVLELLGEKKALSGWDRAVLAPIPSSPRRLRERGYAQAERILAAALPTIGSAAAYAPSLLSRHDRESQVSVARAERAQNIAGAFFIPAPEKVSGACIILIDDVVESGSTLADAKRALTEAGARDVVAVALAH